MKNKLKKWLAEKLYLLACRIDYTSVEEWQKMQRISILRIRKLHKKCSEKLDTLKIR